MLFSGRFVYNLLNIRVCVASNDVMYVITHVSRVVSLWVFSFISVLILIYQGLQLVVWCGLSMLISFPIQLWLYRGLCPSIRYRVASFQVGFRCPWKLCSKFTTFLSKWWVRSLFSERHSFPLMIKGTAAGFPAYISHSNRAGVCSALRTKIGIHPQQYKSNLVTRYSIPSTKLSVSRWFGLNVGR